MAGVSFLDLMAIRTPAGLKREFIAILQAEELPVTSWVPGDPSERWVDLTPRMVANVLLAPTMQAVRGFFLEFATDPGDADDIGTLNGGDPTPRAGFLSALGEGWYGTTRRGETFSTTTVALQNTGSSNATFSPFDLTFTTAPPGDGPLGGGEAAKSDGGRPTFRNSIDDATYVNLDGSITLAPGAAVSLDVACEQIGIYGSVSANSLICVTQSFGSLTTTTSAAALGQGRESAPDYRARCRLAASKLAPGGPSAAYKYAATTARDGTPLQRHDGSGPVGTTKSYVSADSTSGVVVAYFGDDDGAADATDVASSGANITGVALGVITDPLGVVPDAVTYVGSAAVEVTINIVLTAKIKRRAGTSDADLKAAAELAIETVAFPAYFKAIPIGGNDQTAGVGTVLTTDIAGVVYTTKLAGETEYAGLHAVVVTTPGGSSTAIALGRVAKLGTVAATVTVVA